MHTLGLICSNEELDYMFREVTSDNSSEIDFESFALTVTKKVQVIIKL
jgi:Ca2+-binding EF-hand superfamily protein